MNINKILYEELIECCKRQWTREEFTDYINDICKQLNWRCHAFHQSLDENRYEMTGMNITHYRTGEIFISIPGTRGFTLDNKGSLKVGYVEIK